jgi:uncharacterized small protein (DUF1192 family)
MYEQAQMAKCENRAAGQLIGGRDHNPTVEENIDAKISTLRQEIERLEESKKTLAPLLGMRIRDIAEAMRF